MLSSCANSLASGRGPRWQLPGGHLVKMSKSESIPTWRLEK